MIEFLRGFFSKKDKRSLPASIEPDIHSTPIHNTEEVPDELSKEEFILEELLAEEICSTAINKECGDERQEPIGPVLADPIEKRSNVGEPLEGYVPPGMTFLDTIKQAAVNGLIWGNQPLPFLWSVDGETVLKKDLTSLHNILITGSQETGKSTFLHQLIASLLLSTLPHQFKFILVDPKKVELNVYRHLENHFLAKVPGEEDAVISKPEQLIKTLEAICIEVDNRFQQLQKEGVRSVKELKEKQKAKTLASQGFDLVMPYLITVIDDLGAFDDEDQKKIYPFLDHLVGNGNKVGIINIIGTSQLNSSTTTQLKSSIAQKVVFRLNQKDDYRRILDTVKVNRSLPTGTFLYNEDGRIKEGASCVFSLQQLEHLVDNISDQRGYPQPFLLPEYVDEKELEGKGFDAADKDPLFEDAAKLIVQNQIGSTSLLQRRMKLGYNRAGLLMDQLEAAGVVGPNLGSKAREVLIKTDAELMEFFETMG